MASPDGMRSEAPTPPRESEGIPPHRLAIWRDAETGGDAGIPLPIDVHVEVRDGTDGSKGFGVLKIWLAQDAARCGLCPGGCRARVRGPIGICYHTGYGTIAPERAWAYVQPVTSSCAAPGTPAPPPDSGSGPSTR